MAAGGPRVRSVDAGGLAAGPVESAPPRRRGPPGDPARGRAGGAPGAAGGTGPARRTRGRAHGGLGGADPRGLPALQPVAQPRRRVSGRARHRRHPAHRPRTGGRLCCPRRGRWLAVLCHPGAGAARRRAHGHPVHRTGRPQPRGDRPGHRLGTPSARSGSRRLAHRPGHPHRAGHAGAGGRTAPGRLPDAAAGLSGCPGRRRCRTAGGAGPGVDLRAAGRSGGAATSGPRHAGLPPAHCRCRGRPGHTVPRHRIRRRLGGQRAAGLAGHGRGRPHLAGRAAGVACAVRPPGAARSALGGAGRDAGDAAAGRGAAGLPARRRPCARPACRARAPRRGPADQPRCRGDGRSERHGVRLEPGRRGAVRLRRARDRRAIVAGAAGAGCASGRGAASPGACRPRRSAARVRHPAAGPRRPADRRVDADRAAARPARRVRRTGAVDARHPAVEAGRAGHPATQCGVAGARRRTQDRADRCAEHPARRAGPDLLLECRVRAGARQPGLAPPVRRSAGCAPGAALHRPVRAAASAVRTLRGGGAGGPQKRLRMQPARAGRGHAVACAGRTAARSARWRGGRLPPRAPGHHPAGPRQGAARRGAARERSLPEHGPHPRTGVGHRPRGPHPRRQPELLPHHPVPPRGADRPEPPDRQCRPPFARLLAPHVADDRPRPALARRDLQPRPRRQPVLGGRDDRADPRCGRADGPLHRHRHRHHLAQAAADRGRPGPRAGRGARALPARHHRQGAAAHRLCGQRAALALRQRGALPALRPAARADRRPHLGRADREALAGGGAGPRHRGARRSAAALHFRGTGRGDRTARVHRGPARARHRHQRRRARLLHRQQRHHRPPRGRPDLAPHDGAAEFGARRLVGGRHHRHGRRGQHPGLQPRRRAPARLDRRRDDRPQVAPGLPRPAGAGPAPRGPVRHAGPAGHGGRCLHRSGVALPVARVDLCAPGWPPRAGVADPDADGGGLGRGDRLPGGGDRHHPAQGDRAAAGAGHGARRGGQPRQERVPGQHEPRDPLATERGARPDLPAAPDCARQRAAHLPRPHQARQRRAAAHGQRRAGPVQGRGRPVQPRAGAVRSGPDRLGPGGGDGRACPGQAPADPAAAVARAATLRAG